MPGVTNFNDDNVDKLIRLLKKQVERAGLMYDIKKKEYYQKPSVKKTVKSREARRRVARDKRKIDK